MENKATRPFRTGDIVGFPIAQTPGQKAPGGGKGKVRSVSGQYMIVEQETGPVSTVFIPDATLVEAAEDQKPTKKPKATKGKAEE
jgi:hypothetical protein